MNEITKWIMLLLVLIIAAVSVCISYDIRPGRPKLDRQARRNWKRIQKRKKK